MAKTKKSQKDLFTCFKNGFCPYCGTNGATLEENKKVKARQHRPSYRGYCPACKAEVVFGGEKTKEWAGKGE